MGKNKREQKQHRQNVTRLMRRKEKCAIGRKINKQKRVARDSRCSTRQQSCCIDFCPDISEIVRMRRALGNALASRQLILEYGSNGVGNAVISSCSSGTCDDTFAVSVTGYYTVSDNLIIRISP